MEKVVSRFLRYVRIHTESDPSAPPGVLPSAAREFDLARLLVDELRELGLTDAHVDEHCYVYATLPATPGCGALPVIGLLAHMDTSPDLTGKDVNPQILHYDGGELVINQELGVVMDAEHFPELDRFLGEDLIFADGRTLLGADDKGGIAVILQALEDLIAAGTPMGLSRWPSPPTRRSAAVLWALIFPASARTSPTHWMVPPPTNTPMRPSTPPRPRSRLPGCPSIPAPPKG